MGSSSFKQIGKHTFTETERKREREVSHKSPLIELPTSRQQNAIHEILSSCSEQRQLKIEIEREREGVTHLDLRREHCTVAGIDVQVDGTVISAYRMHLLQQFWALHAHCIEYL